MGMGIEDRIDEKRWWNLLQAAVHAHAREDGDFATGISGMFLHRRSAPEKPMPHFMEPVLIIMLQGRKYIRIGPDNFLYEPKDCFVCALDLPVLSCVYEASHATPYLTISVALNVDLLCGYAAKLNNIADKESRSARCKMTPGILDTLLMISDLIGDKPRIACMETALLNELHFHLIEDKSGAIARLIGTRNSNFGQIARAIAWIKENFRNHFTINDLSSHFAISPSALYKNFRTATSLSPIQYQKTLRLCEGKRLLESGSHRVSEAANAVGYESQTQFSREFRRLFGSSPRELIKNQKNAHNPGSI